MDQQQASAFGKAKKLLLSADVLAQYDIRQPVVVECDASAYGLGAVLSQPGEDGRERLVGLPQERWQSQNRTTHS